MQLIIYPYPALHIYKQIVHAISVRRVPCTLYALRFQSFSYSSTSILRRTEVAWTICLLARSHHLICWWIHLLVSSFVCSLAHLLVRSSVQLCSFLCLLIRLRIRFVLCILYSFSFVIHAVDHLSISCTPYINESFTRSRLAVSYLYHTLYWVRSIQLFSCFHFAAKRDRENDLHVCSLAWFDVYLLVYLFMC